MSNRRRSTLTMACTVVLNLVWMFPLFVCGVGLRETSVSAQEKAAQPRFKNSTC
jgi:hypothetical protein